MKIIKEPLQICKPQIKLDEYRRLVFLHAPALGRLLDNLDAGVSPSPLEVMTAISQGVAYLTDGYQSPNLSDQLVSCSSPGHCPTC